MEGYTNVMGSQYDFDDLDIEGWNAEDEGKNTLDKVKGLKLLDERALLSERVRLDSGQQADVFSVTKKNGQIWYTCHICSDTVVGLLLLKQHVETNKHRTNMSNPVHPRAKFVKLDPKENLALEPGEPVPPGLEEVIIKTCLIQPKLDACKASPLIGLEFLVELTQSTLDNGVYYYCLLCEKTGNERNIFIHFTSIFHYMKYLSIYFPTVARKLHTLRNKNVKKSFGLLVTEIIADIEAKYGRMKPHSETHADFSGRKTELHRAICEGPHIRETDGETFAEKATAENVDKKTRELQYAPPATSKNEEREKVEENELSGSMFNKTNRISVDKKQLRPREEETNNSSPDIQIVDIQLPKSPEKNRVLRSKSLSSISTISSSSSHSRGRPRYDSHSRHHSKISNHSRGHRNWSRSRSRSPSFRHRHRGSPSYSRKYSPGRRSRDRSPRRWNRGRRDSHGRSPDRYKFKGMDRYGRSRDKYDGRSDKYRKEKITEVKRSPKEFIHPEEKIRWSKFREDLEKVENIKLEQLKYHEKNPEKHPQYPEEWKSFWNRRYNELQRSGVDPTKHDFKPEWISFWTKRMKELYEEELGKAKDELKKKFDLPDDPQYIRESQWKHSQRKHSNNSPSLVDVSPPTPDKKDVIADIKTTWKAFTGSDIKDTPKRPLSPWEDDGKTRDKSPPMKREARRHSPRSRSLSPITANDKLLEDMPQRKTRTSSLIFVLRKLTVLEPQLGSLAPKVFEILSQALALEKIKEDASLDLLFEEENCVFLETVREKLIALLCAGVVPRNVVNTARSAIKHIDIALYLSSKRERSVPITAVKSSIGGALSSQNSHPNQYIVQPKSEPLVVPGVGQVDKVAIAQQIAVALIEQGKTNVTEGELEQLINAVVGMAEASANSAHPMTTAGFLHQLQSMQNTATSNILTIPVSTIETTGTVFKQSPQLSRELMKDMSNSQPQPAFGALKMLQSAYNDTIKTDQDSPKPDIVEIDIPDSLQISDKELASTLTVFNNTTKEEQPGFIHRLKTTNPEMYKRLCPFIPSSFLTPDRSKRSPITIPISKERSEQRIKPLSSGRLSPFSSRSGGANPTVGEKVILDDGNVNDDYEKSDVLFVAETSSEPRLSKQNQEISKLKFSNSDKDDDDDVDRDDDDDDDYSFEDVYKAAQEKLKQKLLNEEKESNQSLEKRKLEKNEEVKNDIVNESSQLSTEKAHQTLLSDSPAWSSSKQENDMFAASENFQQQKQLKEDNLRMQSFSLHRLQHSFQVDVEKYNETPFQTNQATPYQAIDTSSTLARPETVMRRQLSNQQFSDSQSPFDGNLHQSYQHKDQYLNESSYSQANAAYYDKSDHYPRDPLYSSNHEPYNYPHRDPYATSYRDSYNAQAKPGLSQHMSLYDDQYSYREHDFRGDGYAQARPPVRSSQTGFSSAPPSRYPDPGYPSY